MITIIIPTYNHRVALERCLRSIAAQRFMDYEIIVVDDCSTDDTWQWLCEYKKNVTRYSLLVTRHNENRGAAAARNTGLKEAKGEYVIFCDADVEMQPQMLARMMRTLQDHPDASYVYASFRFGWKTFHLFPFDAERLRRMPYIHSTSLVRRSHIPECGWDESLKKLQDWDFFLTMLDEGRTGIWIPEVLMRVEPRKTGISTWIPSFAYKIPWLPSVRKYRAAERIVKEKHNLV